jgi:hypothetical protein
LRVQPCRVAKSWDLGAAPDFQHFRGVEGRARSPGIRLGRGTRLSSLNLHPKPTTKGLVHIQEHPWVLGQATGFLTHKTHHSPDSGGVTTILPIVFSVPLRRTCIRMTLFPRTPKVESRNCLDFGLPGLWDIIASRPNLRSGQGLNQTWSPLQELFNAVSHSPNARREQVDSRLLVIGSQTGSLTPDPSFAHNLGCRCPNDQCEAISDIYTSRPFQ